MNLRITDAAGLVHAMDHLLRKAGEPVHSAGGWTVARVGGALFYHGLRPESAGDGAGTPEVGGPYPSLGALVRDAGGRVAASAETTAEGDPEWEIRAWAGGFYVVRDSRPEVPSRHDTLDEALGDVGS